MGLPDVRIEFDFDSFIVYFDCILFCVGSVFYIDFECGVLILYVDNALILYIDNTLILYTDNVVDNLNSKTNIQMRMVQCELQFQDSTHLSRSTSFL